METKTGLLAVPCYCDYCGDDIGDERGEIVEHEYEPGLRLVVHAACLAARERVFASTAAVTI